MLKFLNDPCKVLEEDWRTLLVKLDLSPKLALTLPRVTNGFCTLYLGIFNFPLPASLEDASGLLAAFPGDK